MLKTKQKIALANIVQNIVMGVRRLIGRGPTAKVRRSDVWWELDLREGIDFSIWLLGSFEPRTVRCYQRIVNDGDVVLDIGANIGAHTLLLARAVGPAGIVYAFEPTDYAYTKLLKNCSLNSDLSGRIHCFQTMLVDQEATGDRPPSLYSSWPLSEVEGLHELHQGRLMTTMNAESRTLDSVALSLNLERVDFIKLDIDGFECGMLRGASEVMARWHPIIVMELAPYSLEEQGASLGELIALLTKYGYALYELSSGAPLVMDPELLEKQIPPGASRNVVARPTFVPE
jgi:FkbM family methyltransferase